MSPNGRPQEGCIPFGRVVLLSLPDAWGYFVLLSDSLPRPSTLALGQSELLATRATIRPLNSCLVGYVH